MANHKLRIVVEKLDSKTNKVVSKNTVSPFDIIAPKNILELGLRHTEQINILQSIQDFLVSEQAIFLKEDHANCSKCNGKIWSNGYKKSKFYPVFTDHEIKIQKQKSPSENCNWHSIHTVTSLLWTSVHPDLYKIQCEYGATHSFMKSEEILTTLSNKKPEVNNRERIIRICNKVGEILDQKQLINNINSDVSPAKELTIQVDGGHIHNKDPEKRSFEAMCAKVYRPRSVIEVTEKRTEIINKNCAASARDDKQSSMKKYLLRAAEAQGLNANTDITALADGAKNCWSIINTLNGHCKNLHCILDWFHISKKFENVINHINLENFKELFNIKSLFWKGKVVTGIENLKQLKNKVLIKEEKSKINELLNYLNGNKEYIIDYATQAMQDKPYTSQVAESTVEHLINDRHKRNQKMQWTRKGAHNILQIRASMASNEWDYVWQETILSTLGIAA